MVKALKILMVNALKFQLKLYVMKVSKISMENALSSRIQPFPQYHYQNRLPLCTYHKVAALVVNPCQTVPKPAKVKTLDEAWSKDK